MIIKISKKIKFYVPIEQEKLLGIMKYVIISLSAMALILGVVCGVLYFRTDRLTVEAGSSLTAADITGNKNSHFGDDFDPDCLNHPGVYYFTVITDGKSREVRIEVIDTKAPVITVKEIKWPMGDFRSPKPEDFIDTVVEADGYTGEFIEPLPEFNKNSEVYKAKVRFTDGSGNKTKIFDVVLRLELYDSEAPEIKVLQDTVEIKVGTLPEENGRDMMSFYYDLVKVTDNCAGDISLTVDDSGVDYTETGSYTVYFTASDMVGNKSERVSVTVLIVHEVSESGE